MTHHGFDKKEKPHERLVATIGNFDGVHMGHRHLINAVVEQALKRGLGCSVITFSNHPSTVLNGQQAAPEQIMPVEDRVRLLESLGVQHIYLLEFTRELAMLSSRDFLSMLHERIGVDALVVGFNHHFGHDRGAGMEGGEVEIIEASEYTGQAAPVSSTLIRDLIKRGNVAEASLKLGRPFELSGTVVHGKRNGTAIGFPTANVDVAGERQLLPMIGAYAAMASLDGGATWLPAMAGVSFRPTVERREERVESGERVDGRARSAARRPGVEIHIFDDGVGELYGKYIRVKFVEFLREERKMSGLDELRRQLAADRNNALEALQTERAKHQHKYETHKKGI